MAAIGGKPASGTLSGGRLTMVADIGGKLTMPIGGSLTMAAIGGNLSHPTSPSRANATNTRITMPVTDIIAKALALGKPIREVATIVRREDDYRESLQLDDEYSFRTPAMDDHRHRQEDQGEVVVVPVKDAKGDIVAVLQVMSKLRERSSAAARLGAEGLSQVGWDKGSVTEQLGVE